MKKFIEFDGRRYCRDEVRGYYFIAKKSGEKTRSLHRDVWKFYNGDIPLGMFVHHIDGDKSNNEIDNLALMHSSEHSKIHIDKIMDVEKDLRAKKFIESAHPKAKEWHASDAGREWHREHAKKALADSKIRDFEKVCSVCGEKYLTTRGARNRSKFCSPKCCSKSRRMSGADDVERYCKICGSRFKVNKFEETLTCSRYCASILAIRSRGDN